MKLKKIKTIGIFATFILCFIVHFIYSWFPNIFTSIFFSVNESIWEHMKMMTTSILIWSYIEYFLLKKYRINHNNFWINVFIECIISIPVYLIIYYPIYLRIGENFTLNITILFITIFISYITGYKILEKNRVINDNYGIVGIIMLYILYSVLTYNPPKWQIFYDNTHNSYGINKSIK